MEHRESAAVSEKGPVRAGNEDAFLADDARGVYAVVDGMGGMGNGDRAAAITVDELRATGDLPAALRRANRRLRAESGGASGMGCVLTAVRIEGDRARIFHMGDTRAVLVSDAGCERLTRDHTVAAVEQERGGLSDGEAGLAPGRNVVTRDLGGADPDDPSWPDEIDAELRSGDLLVLTTDGVHGSLPASHLHALLRAARRERRLPDRVARDLIDGAYANGSTDNATALVVALYEPSRNEPPRARGPAARRLPRGKLAATHGAVLLLGFALGWWCAGPAPIQEDQPGAVTATEVSPTGSTPAEAAATPSLATEAPASPGTSSTPATGAPAQAAPPTPATPAMAWPESEAAGASASPALPAPTVAPGSPAPIRAESP